MITYKGRGTRTQYLIVSILVQAVLVVAFLAKSFSADGAMIGSNRPTGEGMFFYGGILAIILYSLTALLFETARRCKDINISGWFSLILFIPAVSQLFSFLLFFIPGTKGTNRFGSDPREQDVSIKRADTEKSRTTAKTALLEKSTHHINRFGEYLWSWISPVLQRIASHKAVGAIQKSVTPVSSFTANLKLFRWFKSRIAQQKSILLADRKSPEEKQRIEEHRRKVQARLAELENE